MPKTLRYSKPERKWYYNCVARIGQKTVASGKIWAKKISDDLVYPSDMSKQEKETYRDAFFEELKNKKAHPSEREADNLVRELIKQWDRSGQVFETNDKMSLFQLFDMYLDKKHFKKTSAKKSVEQALNLIKHILAHNPKVKDLNIKHYETIINFREKYKWNQKINEWVLWQKHPNPVRIAPTTTEKELICLRTALDYAVKENWITKNYLPDFPENFRDKVTEYKNSSKDIYFSTAEVHAIADCMKETSFMLPTLLASVTGLRRNEILSLQWKDWTQEPVMNDSTNEKIMVHFLQVKRSLFYDDNKKQWTVIKADGTINPPKTPASIRKISLGYCGEDNFAVKILEEQKKIQHANNIKRGSINLPKQSDFIFSHKDGSLFAESSFTQAFIRARNEANKKFENGLSDVEIQPGTLHDLRHYHVSELIEEKASDKQISTRLGHKSVAFTIDRYGHLRKGSDVVHVSNVQKKHDDFLLS
jgi:integrase